jgi:hypothetical protein
MVLVLCGVGKGHSVVVHIVFAFYMDTIIVNVDVRLVHAKAIDNDFDILAVKDMLCHSLIGFAKVRHNHVHCNLNARGCSKNHGLVLLYFFFLLVLSIGKANLKEALKFLHHHCHNRGLKSKLIAEVMLDFTLVVSVEVNAVVCVKAKVLLILSEKAKRHISNYLICRMEIALDNVVLTLIASLIPEDKVFVIHALNAKVHVVAK